MKSRSKKRESSWKSLLLQVIIIVIVLSGLFVAGFALYLHAEIKERFESRRWSVPSRVFSATVPLYPGQVLPPAQLREMLEARRYRESSEGPLRAGEYRAEPNGLSVHLREFNFPGRSLPGRLVRFHLDQNRIRKIDGETGAIAFLELEPLEMTRLFGRQRESRLLINIHRTPPHLVQAIISIEDHRFFDHKGMDARAIFRALWVDLKARRVVQGGSTITQQLVKNYFLQPERSLKRKVLEASMALILEAMYSKEDILEMYMNEIYLGQRGSVAIHGFGEAALHYFGKNVEDLDLPEAALLAGMIRGPSFYSPLTHPEASLQRRNVVLRRMLELEKIKEADFQKAIAAPLKLAQTLLPVKVAPYFVDYVRQQLQELYEPSVLESEGLSIYTTLHPQVSRAAEKAVRDGLEELEGKTPGASGDASDGGPLQAALVVIQPRTGSVLALVGGRDYAQSNFNRALHARRQPGSAIKPFVYLSALDQFTAVSRLDDGPARYRVGDRWWTPRNYDQRYRGTVTFRGALRDSLNAATVDLAMQVGLEKVIQTLRECGIQSALQPYPSLALGAFEVTPLELVRAFSVLGNDGQRPFLLSLREVVTEEGDVQERRHVDFTSVTTPAKVFLITDILKDAVETGTGRVLKSWGIDFPCAGKTGTTSDYKDSWFVGYTDDLLAAVWVGYDDNRPTKLSGARGAGRIWARFMTEARPWFHAGAFKIPPGVVERFVCPDSGELAAAACPQRVREYFVAENVPGTYCTLHSTPW